MAKNITAVASSVRDLKAAPERTKLYIKALTRKSGVTAHDLRDLAGAVTKHNSWSLQRLADAYGFVFEVSAEKDSDGYRRYFFTPKAPKASKAPVPAKPSNDDVKAKKSATIIVTAKKPSRRRA